MSDDASAGPSVDLLAAIRTEAAERLARDLHQVRTALTSCYDQAIAGFDHQWVPLDLVSQLVNELSAGASAERERAAGLSAALESAKHQVQELRSECQATIAAAREASDRDRREIAAQFERELSAARAAAKSAAAAEARLRAELSDVRTRFQEIVDSQMLQLVTFKRELEQATQRTDAPRPGTDASARDTERRSMPADAVGAQVSARTDRRGSGDAPAFDRIEAALASSPPLGKWTSPRTF